MVTPLLTNDLTMYGVDRWKPNPELRGKESWAESRCVTRTGRDATLRNSVDDEKEKKVG